MEKELGDSSPRTSAQGVTLPYCELSVVIPCFNEAAGIAVTAASVLAYLDKHFPDYLVELILIDDGSTDGTGQALRDLAARDRRIHPIFFPLNRGRGAALKAGIAASRGNFLITLDADLSYDVDHIGAILSCFEAQPKTDVVVVSPYMAKGSVRGVPFQRLFISKMANWILAGFFSKKLSTVTCVVRGYRGSVLRTLPLFEDNKELHLEVLRKLALCGANIQEIPGRLHWKETKTRAARKAGGLKIFSAASRHFFYAVLIKPTRIFKWAALALLVVGLYETLNIGRSTLHFYQALPEGFWFGVWKALSLSFRRSPHTFFIAGISLILSFQAFSYLALTQIMKLQQEETLRHLIALLQKGYPPTEPSRLTH